MKVNNDQLKAAHSKRTRPAREVKLNKFSEENGIPVRYVIDYGIDFLKENPIIVEALHEITKISGKFTFLTKEEIEVRRAAMAKTQYEKVKKYKRENNLYLVHTCKVCSKEFTLAGTKTGNGRKTCSDECRDELHRIQSNEAGARQRLKRKKNLAKSK
jgi:hypothetical protein